MSKHDVYDPGIYMNSVPWDTFKTLRNEAPVYWHEEPRGGRGFWAITKHKDVVSISRDPGTFSSERGSTFLEDQKEDVLPVLQTFMLNMDPPQHIRFRNMVKHAFVPQSLRLLEPKIRKMVRGIIDRVGTRGECDFVADIACKLPLGVIAEMIGVPEGDRDKVYDWSNKMVAFDDPEFQSCYEDAEAASAEMYQYAFELGQERADNPGQSDDIISKLMANIGADTLTIQEFASFFMLLFVAGNETTRNATSGGMLALMQNPAEAAKLQAHPELLPQAIEEILRWVSPLIYFRRTATKDTEIRGVKIKENDKVVLYYPSANRDEDLFENPEQFNVSRTPNDHLAFGTGQHVCLGANLARFELRCIFEELTKRLPDIQLVGEPRRLRSNFLNGIKTMPVRFTPERARAMP
jgi:cholest-4-en-3-one 26-monooxygenase